MVVLDVAGLQLHHHITVEVNLDSTCSFGWSLTSRQFLKGSNQWVSPLATPPCQLCDIRSHISQSSAGLTIDDHPNHHVWPPPPFQHLRVDPGGREVTLPPIPLAGSLLVFASLQMVASAFAAFARRACLGKPVAQATWFPV